jgi:glycosyltransferase involved in cell wall biosynthesis
MDYKKIPGKTLKKYGEYQNNDPVISIITPFYNTGKEIEETYNSVMNQTYPYFEWIIVDDGSTNEESIKLLSDISKRDDRIKTYTIKNGGPSIARDYGIEKTSKTKYVFFLDSDDMIDKTTLECFYWTL